MESRITKIKDHKEFSRNPFMENFSVKIKPKTNVFLEKNKGVIDLSTGELKDDALLIGRRKYIDKEDFVKIFLNELKVIFNLSKSTQKVFAYMLTCLGFSDTFIFNIEDCQEYTGYRSKGPIFKSLAELLREEFIAKTKNQFVYWINPKIFYRGDRLVIIREYRKNKSKQIEKRVTQDNSFKSLD